MVNREDHSKEIISQDSNGVNFLGRVFLYGLLGAIGGQRGGNLAKIAFGGPIIERMAGITFEDVLAADAERQRQLEAQQRQKQVLDALHEALNDTLSKFPSLTIATASGNNLTMLEPDAQWRQVIIHPSVVLILGKRGIGKTALGYRLLELSRYGPRPYVVGVPASAQKDLPDWIGIAPSLEDVPPNSIALVDEAYLSYHARGSLAAESKSMSQLVNLSRQREQTLIFVSQEARQVDRNIASSANVIVFKDLGIFQLEFDRPELNKLATQARQAFTTVTGDKRRWSFAYSQDADFIGLLENNLPSFWKPSLSRLFAAGSSPSQPRKAKRMAPQEKAQKAREMRTQGASYGEICRALGVKSRSTIQNYLKGYPYQR